MLKKRSAPMSAPKPASVTRKSPQRMPIRSAMIDELPCAMLPKGPACTSTGVFSSVWSRLGLIASRRITVIAPAAESSSAVIGLPAVVLPITIRPSRWRISRSDVVSASTVMTSEAAVMSNPVERMTPSSRVPRPTMTLRSTRSLTSNTRRHVTVWRSTWKKSSFWWTWLSIIAASRLWAAVTACMSPVRWRLSRSIGTTWL